METKTDCKHRDPGCPSRCVFESGVTTKTCRTTYDKHLWWSLNEVHQEQQQDPQLLRGRKNAEIIWTTRQGSSDWRCQDCHISFVMNSRQIFRQIEKRDTHGPFCQPCSIKRMVNEGHQGGAGDVL